MNETRKGGIHFLGNPRRTLHEGGNQPYHLVQGEIADVKKMWDVYRRPEILKRISEFGKSLRQAGLRASHYYEMSNSQESAADRLLSLAIALESLLSSNSSEITFRVCLGLSHLIGSTAPERIQLFEQTRKFYERRSKLVHGDYDVKNYMDGTFVTHKECDEWAEPIRRAILAFLILHLRGEGDKNEMLNKLKNASLDNTVGCKLRSDSSMELFLKELETTA